MNGTAVFDHSFEWPWPKRAAFVAGFVFLSVGLALVIMVTAQKTLLRGVNNPEQYAIKTTRVLDKKLSLTTEQTAKLQGLLRDHREKVNGIDRDEFALWETLFHDLPTASPTELTHQMEAINLLQQQRDTARLKALLEINGALTPTQKAGYSQLMVELAQKLRQQQRDSSR